MSSGCELQNLPTTWSRDAIDEIAKKEKFKNLKITVDSGSSKGDNYLGEIYRVNISGVRENGKSDSTSLILKYCPDCPQFKKSVPIDMFYKRENFAYSKMLPTLSKLQEEYELPVEQRFKHAKFYKGLKDMLIFDDLCVYGFQMYNRMKAFDYDHLTFSVKNLARYHATSFVLHSRDPELYNELAMQTSTFLDFGDGFQYYMGKSVEKILSIVIDPDDIQKLIAFFGVMGERLSEFVNMKTCAPYNVLCHGDCWSNNFLFSYKNGKVSDMRMLDWQVIRCASPVTDLAYLLFTSMDEDMRNKHYQEMLELYYETLSNNISKMGFNASTCYPKHIYKEQVKSTMVYGFIMAIGILPLTLADKDNAPNLGQLLDKDFVYEGKDLVYSDECVERMRSLIKFCIKEKMI